jgi:putative acetyltransferase
MIIVPGDLSDPRIMELLRVHLCHARAHSPPCSTHALDLSGLRAPEITFWAAWQDEVLAGVGALLELAPDHGEVKSMHTAEQIRGRGVGAAMLLHIVEEARRRGYSRLSLETGSMDYFAPARGLYRRYGFSECEPFGRYVLDPNSTFMTLDLASQPRNTPGGPYTASTK